MLSLCEAASSSSSLPSEALYHYTLHCLPGFVALAVPIQRLNCAGQRWPTWDEMQEEGVGRRGSLLPLLRATTSPPLQQEADQYKCIVTAVCSMDRQSDIQQSPCPQTGRSQV